MKGYINIKSSTPPSILSILVIIFLPHIIRYSDLALTDAVIQMLNILYINLES